MISVIIGHFFQPVWGPIHRIEVITGGQSAGGHQGEEYDFFLQLLLDLNVGSRL